MRANITRRLLPLLLTISGTAAVQARDIVTDTLGFTSAMAGNVTELLRGQIAGVRVSSIDNNPVGGVNVQIRGINSLRTDNQPLWIIDGVYLSTDLRENLDAFWQYGEQSYTAPLNPLAFLNAKEIESIEVLKDAAATAIYGVRGANGVVIVNTKMPHGETNGFEISSDMGWDGGFGSSSRAAFSGGADGTRYNLSAALRTIGGELPGNSSDYVSFKGNFETRANRAVWFGFNSLIGGGRSYSPSGVTYLGLPSLTLARRDPALSPGTSESDWEDGYDDKTEDYRALLSSYIRLNFAENMYAKFSAGMDLQSNYRTIWYGSNTSFGAPSEENVNGSAASNLVSFLASWNASGEFNWYKYFAVHHRLDFKAGMEYLGNNNKFNTLNGINFVSEELRGNSLLVGAYDTRIHKFVRHWSHVGAYATLRYDYKGILDIDGVLRGDRTPRWSSEGTDICPSATLTFDAHRAFLRGNTAISTLRLQAGYGISGYEKYVPYELFGNYLSSSWYEPEEGTSTFYDGVDKLKTREYSVSAEAGFLNDRWRLKAAFYDRTTDDDFLMYRMGHAPEDNPDGEWVWGGCERVFKRGSSIRNQGLEMELHADIISTRDLKWSVSANLTRNANEVTSSNAEDFLGKVVGHGVWCTCNAKGLPVSSLYGYRTDSGGNYLDITGEGRVDEADKVILGSTIPKWYGGLQSVLSCGRWTLDVTLDGAAGYKVANVNELVRDGVTDINGLICLSSKYVERADHLRLTQVGVSWRPPVSSRRLKDLTLRLSCRNLATLTSYSGYSPDVNCFGASTLSNGLDYGSYPVSRIIMAGASLNF